MSSGQPRRIAAVLLPQLACELAWERAAPFLEPSASGDPFAEAKPSGASVPKTSLRTPSVPPPIAVVLLPEQGTANHGDAPQRMRPAAAGGGTESKEAFPGGTPIHAINEAAGSYGVKVGQTLAEARAWVSHLRVYSISPDQLRRALERVAECLFRFAPTISMGYPDTVWLDITGTAHLFEGEEGLLRELLSSVGELGHFTRVAIADGPILAQAFARWQPVGRRRLGVLVAPEETRKLTHQLPIWALPVPDETRAWLARLGLLEFGDLAKLPKQQVLARLERACGKFRGSRSQRARANETQVPERVLELLDGIDRTPLTAYVPVGVLHEELEWEQPITGCEALSFVTRGLLSKLSSRLDGRGLAARAFQLQIQYDRSIARLRGATEQVVLDCSLVSPLFRTEDLWRVARTKLEKLRLAAPCIGLRIEMSGLSPKNQRQLDLMSTTSRLDPDDPERLQVLFSDLAAELGEGTFGTLVHCNSHRPEKASLLHPVAFASASSRSTRANAPQQISLESARAPQTVLRLQSPRDDQGPTGELPASARRRLPNRLLTTPVLLPTPLEKGALVPFAGQLYSIREMIFDSRLDCVEWWSGENISRDYQRVTLEAQDGLLEVLVYRNRITGRSFLQAVYD